MGQHSAEDNGVMQAADVASNAVLKQTPAARAVNLAKYYGEGDTQVTALAGVTVDFNRGEFTAIMGHRGQANQRLCTAWQASTPPRLVNPLSGRPISLSSGIKR